ncbi:hypothetical protein RERY_41410 [Rhodococcus erythropolis]|jgi:hypothetical protein|nr:hypothetical protein [Rhodococcus erythropolis]OFV75293.1 hypothetical protein RERY_41410 [Rhodococcus erythropolis]
MGCSCRLPLVFVSYKPRSLASRTNSAAAAASAEGSVLFLARIFQCRHLGTSRRAFTQFVGPKHRFRDSPPAGAVVQLRFSPLILRRSQSVSPASSPPTDLPLRFPFDPDSARTRPGKLPYDPASHTYFPYRTISARGNDPRGLVLAIRCRNRQECWRCVARSLTPDPFTQLPGRACENRS